MAAARDPESTQMLDEFLDSFFDQNSGEASPSQTAAVADVATSACSSQADAATPITIFLSDHIFTDPNLQLPEGTTCMLCGKNDYSLARWEAMGDDVYVCMTCYKIMILTQELMYRTIRGEARVDVNDILDLAIHIARLHPVDGEEGRDQSQ